MQKRSNPHTVRSWHGVCSRCWCKKVKPHTVGMRYAVGKQCAVGVGAKRSTGTVDLANMGGGDHYL